MTSQRVRLKAAWHPKRSRWHSLHANRLACVGSVTDPAPGTVSSIGRVDASCRQFDRLKLPEPEYKARSQSCPCESSRRQGALAVAHALLRAIQQELWCQVLTGHVARTALFVLEWPAGKWLERSPTCATRSATRSGSNVYLDDEFAFGLPALEAAKLHVGQYLSDADVARLQELDAVQKAYDRAVQFLSYRPRSQG